MIALGPAGASAAAAQKQVLVLYSTRPDAQIAIVGERVLPRILADGLNDGVDYYSEFIDQSRFPDARYDDALRDFLTFKYNAHNLGLIIAMNDGVLGFLERHRDELFPATPVVFLSRLPSTRRAPNSTGVVATVNLSGTLDLALALQPDTQRVFVVSGSGDRSYEDLARTQFASYAPRLEITYLSALPIDQLEARVRSLPAHSIIYYLVVNRDGTGNNVHPLDFLERLAAVANAPTYCWVDSAMGRRIVGGNLKDQGKETEMVGELAVRVLRGEPADRLPPVVADSDVRQVDWRELRRWRIPESRVPAGTVVLFREATVWQRYRTYIVGALLVLLAQTALIVGLLVQSARRRQAERLVRASRAELQTSYGRIRDLVGRLLNAQEAERSRIARDLHDDIGQRMAVLAIDLELLRVAGKPDTDTLAVDAAANVQEIARSVRDMSHRLHPARLRLIGLQATLSALLREVRQPGLLLTFTHDNVPMNLPTDLMLCIFRVAQEALGNAVKYSGGHEVSIHLGGAADALTLTVADDGSGFDVDAAWGKGLGLVSMAERVEALGGTLTVTSRPGAGTRLEVRVPLQQSAQDAETMAV
jgi:signal transduction histidine kinase